MTDGLAALTKLVKVVMSYRPARKNVNKPAKKLRAASGKTRSEKRPLRGREGGQETQ